MEEVEVKEYVIYSPKRDRLIVVEVESLIHELLVLGACVMFKLEVIGEL
jgi:hypothetical protein